MICAHCKKDRVYQFTCRCAHNFCNKCYRPEKHNCTFDYYVEHQKELKEKNPKIVSEKVKKI